MTVFRFSAQAGTYDRGAMFPYILAGLLGLWALIALAISCNPKLVAATEDQGVAAYVSCQPAGPGALQAPGQLLRCTVQADRAPILDI